ncbi:MAG: PP2C family protein-serine/threonine phosphatase [Lachnospiraceae bacterium]|nr:PP2C family protein-serine/threonine phosphatase [Lachnospiraceae bacterium]
MCLRGLDRGSGFDGGRELTASFDGGRGLTASLDGAKEPFDTGYISRETERNLRGIIVEKSKLKNSLSRRITMLLLILMAIMAVIVGFISYKSLRNTYINLYSEKAQDMTKFLAGQIDGDLLPKYVETRQEDEYYRYLKRLFDHAKQSITGIQYLYLYYPEEDQFIYIVEGMKEGDDPANIADLTWEPYKYGETEKKHLLPDVHAKRASTEVILGPDVGYGETVAAWAPVLDSEGNLVAMVEADCIMADLNKVIRRQASFILGFQILFILISALAIIYMLRRVVVSPVTYLTNLVDSYEHGELMEDLSKFKYDDEVRSLALSFQDMTARIETYIRDLTIVTAEKERIGAELNVATQIQADMLPRIFPPFPDRNEFQLYATMNPAKEVGGDFYDYFLIDEDHLVLVMADVSGKGVPAALFMVIAKTLLKNRAQMGNFTGPGQILMDVNNQLCEGNEAELFVTVWMGILTISSGHLVSASAGHEYPAYFRGESFGLEKERHGPPLATMEGLRFRETETDLKPGQSLFLYTDGVTEATSADVELFGEKRLTDSLSAHATDDVTDLLKHVREDIDSFVGDAPQFDDITMLCLKYLGEET